MPKFWTQLGFEPQASRTLSENDTTQRCRQSSMYNSVRWVTFTFLQIYRGKMRVVLFTLRILQNKL